MRLRNILSRFNENDFQDILGSDAIKILHLLENKEIYTKDLRAIALDLFGDKFFVDNPESRIKIFYSLKQNEAVELAGILKLKYNSIEEIYLKLPLLKFPKNSSNIKKLYDFFDIPNHIEEKKEQLESFNQYPSYPLFKHQRDAAKNINFYLNNPPFRVLLHMPTGSGKTRTTMNIVCDYLRSNENKLVIWLATTEELCEQAFDEFSKAWSYLGNRELDIYKLWGNSKIEDIKGNSGLIIAGLPKLNSLISSKNYGVQNFIDFSTRLDFIIMDEAHQAIAPTYQFIIETIFNVPNGNSKKLLGLSATPGRSYNDLEEDRKLSNFFGNNKVVLRIDGYDNPVDYLVDEGYLASITYKEILYENPEKDQVFEHYVDIPVGFLKKLGQDDLRNIQIILNVEELTKRHKRIIVFAPSVQSSDLISIILRYRGFNTYSLTSNTDSWKRKEIISEFKKVDDEVSILVNYGILTTGFDAPKTSAAVIARPTMSLVLYSQMVGRAIRGVKAGGNKTAEIATIIDSSLPGFDNVANAFLNWEDVWN